MKMRRARRAFQTEILSPAGRSFNANTRLVYVLTVDRMLGEATLAVHYQKLLKSGGYGKLHPFRFEQHDVPTTEDAEVCAMLTGAMSEDRYGYHHRASGDEFLMEGPIVGLVLPRLCRSGQLYLDDVTDLDDRDRAKRIGPCRLDEEMWRFGLTLQEDQDERLGRLVRLRGEFSSGDKSRPVDAAVFVSEGGLVFFDDATVARVEGEDALAWVEFLRHQTVEAPEEDREDVVRELLRFPRTPRIAAPGVEMEVADPPQPRLVVQPRSGGRRQLDATAYFRYGDDEVEAGAGESGLEVSPGRFVMRDRDVEDELIRTVSRAGAVVERGAPDSAVSIRVPVGQLTSLVDELLRQGWIVEAEGHRRRRFQDIRMSVSSGIDWFDLDGTVVFDDKEVKLARVLTAMRKGTDLIQLGDGSVGVLPEDWLKQIGMLVNVGQTKKGQVRFNKSQAWLLDALLAAREQVDFDVDFQRFRDRLHQFEGIASIDEDDSFHGTLRDYQRVGLGWFEFLAEMGLGGCLADDMGLGKTVQVLALLERRRRRDELTQPALVVAPRSVVSNWISEAERFTPELTVLEYTGPQRHRRLERIPEHHLVVTTYGTLRSDAVHLKDVRFSYAVLDEAQAIKNEQSQTAKAARLLDAGHRLALSGTPIENHLGELWSLFEFLNPGMLGRSSAFKRIAGTKGLRDDDALRDAIRRALRPFILRRTKDQVAKSLPSRIEQSIFCDLEPKQRDFYRAILKQYRESLEQDAEASGAFKLHVLEALLRLRQAACHPGLVDAKRAKDRAAKLDTLLPMLEEVVDGGHKALVFSQFTSMLDLLEPVIQASDIGYTRLDGSTRKRRERVEQFQNDPACSLFLISLKAGGLGLNLTAAEYVFILDPWWNPAAEAQAIDRAHRIGQTRQVVAYRLIARDTVEDKILELQARKRDLADAILTEDGSMLRDLTAEDLEFLLS